MLYFFELTGKIIAVNSDNLLSKEDTDKIIWLFGSETISDAEHIEGYFIGPRKEMITPWSTNAVEITQNMGISGITRIEEFIITDNPDSQYD
ncbi:MAG TPA: hypothetical protein DEQ09_01410, partial [Bacteroidales bacterium]|nr:hypothetical protein [Bacteroidales bacterium]